MEPQIPADPPQGGFENRRVTLERSLDQVLARVRGTREDQKAYLTAFEAEDHVVPPEMSLSATCLRSAQKKITEGDACKALEIICNAADHYKYEESLWIEEYRIGGCSEAAIIFSRAMSFLPDSKKLVALSVANRFENDQTLIRREVDRFFDRWLVAGCPGGDDSWLESALLMEEEGFPRTCKLIILHTIEIRNDRS